MQEGEHDTYLQLFKWGKGDLWLLKEAHSWTDGLNTKGQRFHVPFHLKAAIILREPSGLQCESGEKSYCLSQHISLLFLSVGPSKPYCSPAHLNLSEGARPAELNAPVTELWLWPEMTRSQKDPHWCHLVSVGFVFRMNASWAEWKPGCVFILRLK